MSKRKHSTQNQTKDEVLYCERCGISFLWTQEEQDEAEENGTKKQAFCPGCRYLLPSAERERGLVKWYNGRKRFGFIVRQNHPELFVHGSELTGRSRLQEGDLVEFAVTQTEKGLAAQGVTILQRAKERA